MIATVSEFAQTAPDGLDVDAAAQAAGGGSLPFAFARRFGVVITDDVGPNDQVVVAYRIAPTFTTLAEIKRYARRPITLRSVADEEFEALVIATYARDSSQAKQMVEDMGDELDLASLADSVPEN